MENLVEEKEKLVEDLKKKLDQLRLTREQPEVFISERFASLRNEVDFDIEKYIQIWREFEEMDLEGSALMIEETNSDRTKVIEFLENLEQNLYKKLLEAPLLSTETDSLKEIEKQVDGFIVSEIYSVPFKMEEAYIQIALRIMEETNELEKRLMGNQTITYVQAEDENAIGRLFYLSEDYLNREELTCLKSPFSINLHDSFDIMTDIDKNTQSLLKSSLAVPISQPFILNKNLLIIRTILLYDNEIDESDEEYYDSDDDDLFYDPKRIRIIKKDEFNTHIISVLGYHSESFFEAVRLEGLVYCSFKPSGINLSDNRLKSFKIHNSIMKSLEYLNLSYNQLEALDSKQLSLATELETLSLVNACIPGTNFTIDFLPSLTELVDLELCLPDAPIDFGVFKNLKQISSICLKSAASQDSAIQCPKLEANHFKRLSVMKLLKYLQLSFFQIDQFHLKMLRLFSQLEQVHLDNNQINRIGQSAIDNATNSLLPELIDLDLSNNRIKQLSREFFGELSTLNYLNLDHNLIDSIGADVFESLCNLQILSTKNCRLKSIDSNMFKNLKRLSRLSLDYNPVEHIRLVNESEDIVIKGILSRVEYMLVRDSLFCGLTNLHNLSLKGNKLEKIDLNCFFNLTALQTLDLSHNLIDQINEEVQPGVLINLINLNLGANKLTTVARHAFSESRRLEYLYLSGNLLERLDEDFFEPFELLKRLDLQENNFSITITARTFRSQINSLKEINLLRNSAVRIENGAFKNLNKLDNIHLEWQSLDTLTNELFLVQEENQIFLTKLTSISIVNGSIGSFDVFRRGEVFTNLTEINLSHNRIRSIKQECLSDLKNLELLNLSGNLIETIDDPSTFQVLPKLQNLNLSRNKLKHIHRRTFWELSKLESLDLSNNPTLTNIDPGMFRGLFTLEKLNLAGNNISAFDLACLFSLCRLIECVDLSNNQLDKESINEESMSGITAQTLKELMLANNRLENMDFVRNLYRLEKLDLSGNKIESVTSPLGINFFGRLMDLNHVDLSTNQIKSLDIETVFSHLKYRLKFIDLSNNPFNMHSAFKCIRNFSKVIEDI